MFGRSTHQLDPKGRVFIPKRLQGKLPADANGVRSGMLTRGMDGCLALMGEEQFQAEVRRLQTSLFAGANGRRFQRLFFAHSFPVSLDKNGRLQLPKELRSVAGLDDESEVELVGLEGRIEIWAASRWASEVDAFSHDYDGLAPKLPEVDPFGPGQASDGARGGEA